MNRSPKTSARSPQSARDDIYSAVTSIRQVVRVLRVASRKTESSAGISAAQLFVLQQLGDGEELSLNELAERTLTDRSSVAWVVDRLQTQGLVRRTTDPDDRRRAAVQITTTGRRTVRRAPDAPTTALLAALRRLDRRELTGLARSLRRLVESLGAASEPPSMLFTDDGAARRALPSRHRLAKRSTATEQSRSK